MTPALETSADAHDGEPSLQTWDASRHGFLAMKPSGEEVPVVVAALARGKNPLGVRDRERVFRALVDGPHSAEAELNLVSNVLSNYSETTVKSYVGKCRALLNAIEERREKQRLARQKKSTEGNSADGAHEKEKEEEEEEDFEIAGEASGDDMDEEYTFAVLEQMDAKEMEPKIAGDYMAKEKARKAQAVIARWKGKQEAPRAKVEEPPGSEPVHQKQDGEEETEEAAAWRARSGTPWIRHYVPKRLPGMAGLCTLDHVSRDPSYSAKYGSKMDVKGAEAVAKGLHRDIGQASKTKFFKQSEHLAFQEVLKWLWDKHFYVLKQLGIASVYQCLEKATACDGASGKGTIVVYKQRWLLSREQTYPLFLWQKTFLDTLAAVNIGYDKCRILETCYLKIQNGHVTGKVVPLPGGSRETARRLLPPTPQNLALEGGLPLEPTRVDVRW